MRSGSHRTGIPTRLAAGCTLGGIILLAGCGDNVSLQAMSVPRPAQAPSISSEAPPASSGRLANDAWLRIRVLPNEGEWAFQVTVSDDTTYAVHVIDDQGRTVQTIEDLVSRPPYTTKDLIDIRDYNDDGYNDILVRTLPVGSSAISGGLLYIFHADSRTFIESEGIDQEGEISIESNGCISVEYRSDAMNYSKDHYCWRSERWEFQRTTKD